MSQTIIRQSHARIDVAPGGNIVVEYELSAGEHHSTNRANAADYVRNVLGAGYVIRAYLGKVHYRDSRSRNVYAVVYPAPTPVCVGRYVTRIGSEGIGHITNLYGDQVMVEWRDTVGGIVPVNKLQSIGA